MSLKNMFQKLLHILDLTRHTNARLLLQILYFLHIFFELCMLIILTSEIIIFKKQCIHSKEMCVIYNLAVGIGTSGVFTVAVCIILIWLGRRHKTDIRRYLRYYYIWNMSAVPLVIVFLTYLKYQIWSVDEWRQFDFYDPIIFIVFLSLKLFLIGNVIRLYTKLGCTLGERWKQYKNRVGQCQGQDQIGLTLTYPSVIIEKNVPNDLRKGSTTTIGTITSADDVPFQMTITDEHFKAKTISPMDVIIDSNKSIGEGQFGKVFLGTLRQDKDNKITIAAKVVKDDEGQHSTFQIVLQEIKIAIAVGDHENIVRFFGVSSDFLISANFAIITEFCEAGCLEKFLQDNRHTFVDMLQERGSVVFRDQQLYINLELHGTHTSMDLVRFAREISHGMRHLAQRKIIHGDLAARNILLTKDLKVKLTDFGMSRTLYNYQSYISGNYEENQCLPWRWMAVETLEDLKFSEKSDVYAYGVVLWEIFSLGCLPFEKSNWSPEILRQLQSGFMLQRPAFASRDIYKVMENCWNLDPSKRPSFKNIVEIFNDSKISVSCELNLNT